MDRTAIVIPKPLKRWATAEAARQGVSFGELVRRLMERARAVDLVRRGHDPLFATLDEEILAAKGRRRGTGDSSERHEEIFLERTRRRSSS